MCCFQTAAQLLPRRRQQPDAVAEDLSVMSDSAFMLITLLGAVCRPEPHKDWRPAPVASPAAAAVTSSAEGAGDRGASHPPSSWPGCREVLARTGPHVAAWALQGMAEDAGAALFLLPLAGQRKLDAVAAVQPHLRNQAYLANLLRVCGYLMPDRQQALAMLTSRRSLQLVWDCRMQLQRSSAERQHAQVSEQESLLLPLLDDWAVSVSFLLRALAQGPPGQGRCSGLAAPASTDVLGSALHALLHSQLLNVLLDQPLDRPVMFPAGYSLLHQVGLQDLATQI